MKRWFPNPIPAIVTQGDYERCDLTLHAGSNQNEFLEEFGKLVVTYYLAPLEAIIASGLVPTINLEVVTRRLFTNLDNVTEVFKTFGGEVLATWAEESFSSHTIERRPKPHDSTPCFDAIALGHDTHGNIYLCFIQTKTTQSNVTNNTSSAAVDLGKLDDGHFDIELAGALEEIAERQPVPDKKKAILKALIDPSCRRFKIVVLHEIQAPKTVLSRYSHNVRGDRCRRNASFFQLPSWNRSWRKIGKSAYAKVNNAGSS